MKLHLIWAQARNGVIGRNGQLPWHLPEDLAHFKAQTLGRPVIMGRRTWDSLPARFRPLPGRLNVVLSSRPTWNENGAFPARNMTEALQICEQQAPGDMAWVIGGAQVYALALPQAARCVVTRIDADFDGDAHAPALGPGWRMSHAGDWLTAASGLRYRFETWDRSA